MKTKLFLYANSMNFRYILIIWRKKFKVRKIHKTLLYIKYKVLYVNIEFFFLKMHKNFLRGINSMYLQDKKHNHKLKTYNEQIVK